MPLPQGRFHEKTMNGLLQRRRAPGFIAQALTETMHALPRLAAIRRLRAVMRRPGAGDRDAAHVQPHFGTIAFRNSATAPNTTTLTR
jgi:hypothetical protein